MKTNLIYYLLVVVLFTSSCNKEDDKACLCPPCYSSVNYYGHKVAWIPEFRLGTWINIRENQSGVDTLIFHNDSIWSNFGKYGGVYEGKYYFLDYSLMVYNDASGNPLTYPFTYRTSFDDSICVFYIQRIPGMDFEDWDKYIKIE